MPNIPMIKFAMEIVNDTVANVMSVISSWLRAVSSFSDI